MRASDAPGRVVGRLVALAQGKLDAASTMGGAAASQGRRSKMTFLSREQEAEAVQSDPDAAVQLLVVRQLEGFAKAGKRVAPGEKKAQGGSGGFTWSTPKPLFTHLYTHTV